MIWLRKRLGEPTTYLGVGGAAVALGEAFKVKEAAPVGEALEAVGQGIASGLDPWQAGVMGAVGLLAMFMREKGGR